MAGILFFAVVVASFFTPEGPDPDDATAEIVCEFADDRDAFLVEVYLGDIASLLFLAFTAALCASLPSARRLAAIITR